MPKTVSPGVISIPSVGKFITDVVPDPFDGRDFEYRPRLALLPSFLDQRPDQKKFFMLKQQGQSCTGHALAAVINTALAQDNSADPQHPVRVSPYMLYRLARRYDEFRGERDTGSSLRGAFKGWFYHGVALESKWPKLKMTREPDLDDPEFATHCFERPLGAFYRVNPYRIDDMQSAINELHAICVSGLIHDGWIEPLRLRQDETVIHLIARSKRASALGGHAFALVGYNNIGFLVHNSWGKEWGNGGFATLPYEDWLDSAYDAWVARPGVPRLPFVTGRDRTAPVTQGGVATAPGLNLQRLARHVINLGKEGKLSTFGRSISTPSQIDRSFSHMEEWHNAWREKELSPFRDIVLYAHGGLVSEGEGLKTSERMLNWWLNNRIYPLSFVWETGTGEIFLDRLVDSVQRLIPGQGIGFDLTEQFDRLFEGVARRTSRWLWNDIKDNAWAASKEIDTTKIDWSLKSVPLERAMRTMPGASLLATRLSEYVKKWGDEVKIHLVGHSAGSLLLTGLLPRLEEANLSVESLSLLAPALRVDDFAEKLLPYIGKEKLISRFCLFGLSDRRELDDSIGTHGITPYRKSLLYLVSRALEERGTGGNVDVPLLGMEKFLTKPISSTTDRSLAIAITGVGGNLAFAGGTTTGLYQCNAFSHGGLDNDRSTMTSVVMQIQHTSDPSEVVPYEEYATLQELPFAAEKPTILSSTPTTSLDKPFPVTEAVSTPGSSQVTQTVLPPPRPKESTSSSSLRYPLREAVEITVSPSTESPILDMLEDQGWYVEYKENKKDEAP